MEQGRTTAAGSLWMPACVSRPTTARAWNACCARTPGRRNAFDRLAEIDAQRLIYRLPKPGPNGRTELILSPLELPCAELAEASTASPRWSRRPGNIGIVTTACSHPTRRCARRSPPSRRIPRRRSLKRSLRQRRQPTTHPRLSGAPPPATFARPILGTRPHPWGLARKSAPGGFFGHAAGPHLRGVCSPLPWGSPSSMRACAKIRSRRIFPLTCPQRGAETCLPAGRCGSSPLLPRRWTYGLSWNLLASPLPRPESPPPGDRLRSTKIPVRRPSAPWMTTRAIPSPNPNLRSSTTNGCLGSGPPRAAGPAVAICEKSAPVPPSPYRNHHFRHLPPGC